MPLQRDTSTYNVSAHAYAPNACETTHEDAEPLGETESDSARNRSIIERHRRVEANRDYLPIIIRFPVKTSNKIPLLSLIHLSRFESATDRQL